MCTEVRKYFRKYSISGSNNLSIPYESTKVLRTTFVSTKVCTKVLPYEVIYFRTPHVTSGSTCIVHVRVHVYVCTFEGIKFFEGERALYTRPRTLVSVTRAPSSMKWGYLSATWKARKRWQNVLKCCSIVRVWVPPVFCGYTLQTLVRCQQFKSQEKVSWSNISDKFDVDGQGDFSRTMIQSSDQSNILVSRINIISSNVVF